MVELRPQGKDEAALPATFSTDGEDMVPPTCSSPSHHSTSTGLGGPTAAQVRLKGTPGRVATSCGSNTKWGTPAGLNRAVRGVLIGRCDYSKRAIKSDFFFGLNTLFQITNDSHTS